MSPRPFRRPNNNARRPNRPQQNRNSQDPNRNGRPGGPSVSDGAATGVLALDKPGSVELPAAMSVKELADLLQQTPVQVIKELMKNGIIASINQTVDYETAAV